MAGRKATRRGYRRRSDEEQIAALEARIEELREQVREDRKFSPEAVSKDRRRLELSRADYANLVGVSHLTIYHWENGRSRPRAAQLKKWLAVKSTAKREAWRRLGY